LQRYASNRGRKEPITLKASSPKIVEEEPKVAEGRMIESKNNEVEELTANPKVVEVEELEPAIESKIVEEQAPKGPPIPPPGSKDFLNNRGD